MHTLFTHIYCHRFSEAKHSQNLIRGKDYCSTSGNLKKKKKLNAHSRFSVRSVNMADMSVIID